MNLVGLDLGRLAASREQWILRWESAPPNRDLPREHAPPPSVLEVVKVGLRE